MQAGQIMDASTREDLIKIKNSVLKELNDVEAVYLFGSVAKGTEKLESDIDLAVLADKGFDADKLMFDTYDRYGTKVIPLLFHDKREFLAFLSDKEKVRIA